MLNILELIRFTRRCSGVLLEYEKREKTKAPKELAHKQMHTWGSGCLDILRIKSEFKGKLPEKKLSLFVGNHLSYLDIALVMKFVPVVFVAKQEIKKWPVFGTAADSVGTVWIERGSKTSHKGVLDQIADYIQKNEQSICIFPSGTTALTEEKPWKKGGFYLAKKLNLPVQPFRITYEPIRKAAFIDQDYFLPHLFRLLRPPTIEATIEFHPSVFIENVETDMEKIKQWVTFHSNQISPSVA